MASAYNFGMGEDREQPKPVVLPSKLQTPLPREGTFDRPQLVDALNAGDASMLRVIVAPTGWGKSQLLTHWLTTQTQPIAFVELDTLDNDPTRCWTHLLTALSSAAGLDLSDLINELRAPVLPLVTEIVEPLLVRIADYELTLVVDDFHVIRSPEVHESIEAILDKRAPTMGACVVSRTEPALHLPRRRVRHELIEIRTQDLRMTASEASAVLAEAARTPIDPDLVGQLVERTEGWAAGLYLAGLSLRSSQDHRRFVTNFAGDDRDLSDYLASEVLTSLDDDDREFLMGVAVLDELQPDICNAMLNRHDTAARLDELSRGNLFLLPIDQTRTGFRFHHLFKEWLQLLLARTGPGAVTAAHQRAANAYAAKRDIVRAVNHAIAAEDWPFTHRLLMRHGLRLIDAGNHDTVARWCSQFPADAATAMVFDVAAMRGWTAIIDGDLDSVEQNCTIADRVLARVTTDSRPVMSPGDIPLLRGYQQLLRGSLDAIDDTIVTANAVGISARTEATLRWLRAATDYWLGQANDQALTDALDYAVTQSDPYAVSLSNAYLAHLHLDRFDLDGAKPRTDAAFAEINEHGLSNFGYAALAHLARGRLAIHAADLSRADVECRRSLELAGRRHDILVESFSRIVLAEISHEAGDRNEARAQLKIVRDDLTLLPRAGILAERVQILERQLRIRPQTRTKRPTDVAVEELTDREMTLLRLLPGSLNQRELGRALHLSFNTVKTYNRQIYRKLGVTSRDEAVTAARQAGLL